MKLFLISLLAFFHPLFSSSQSNPCKLKIVTDKLANTKIAYTPVLQVTNGTNKMDLHFYKTGHSIIFSVVVTSEQMFCVDNATSAVIQFNDKSSITLKASNIGNCTGNFQSSMYDNTSASEVEALVTKSIVSINIIGKGNAADFKESNAAARQIQYYFKCIKNLEL
ncbi:MAG: hypothetical protein LH478_10990 [Chitinophagaceae bacterium]|nr:hypothetical protein [Chitinophagaceae bacterium]